ncbi:unnamed protein product, partial [Urochloa humidicola]
RRRREGRAAVRALADLVDRRLPLPSAPALSPSLANRRACGPSGAAPPFPPRIGGRRHHHPHPHRPCVPYPASTLSLSFLSPDLNLPPFPISDSRAKATVRVRAARRRLAPWEALSKAARSRLRQGRDPPANPSLNKRVSSTAGAHGVGRAPCGRRRHGNRSLRRRREAVAPGGMRLFLQADAAAHHPNGRPGCSQIVCADRSAHKLYVLI